MILGINVFSGTFIIGAIAGAVGLALFHRYCYAMPTNAGS